MRSISFARRQNHLEHKRRLLVIAEENLQVVKEQAAKHGIDVPLRLENEIRGLEAQISTLEAEIAQLESDLEEVEDRGDPPQPPCRLWICVILIVLICVIFVTVIYLVRNFNFFPLAASPITPTAPITVAAPHTAIPTPQGTRPCLGRRNIEGGELAHQVEVPPGYVAYFMGWMVDGETGGFFVTFKGPYSATHTFRAGVYCPPIPADSKLVQSTVAQLEAECKKSQGGCSITKTFP